MKRLLIKIFLPNLEVRDGDDFSWFITLDEFGNAIGVGHFEFDWRILVERILDTLNRHASAVASSGVAWFKKIRSDASWGQAV